MDKGITLIFKYLGLFCGVGTSSLVWNWLIKGFCMPCFWCLCCEAVLCCCPGIYSYAMRPLLGHFCTFGFYLDSLKKPVYLWVLLNSRDVILKSSVFQGVLHSEDGAVSWLKVCKAQLCSWHKLSWAVWTSKSARRRDGLKLLAVKMHQGWWIFCEAKAVGAVLGSSRLFWVTWGHLLWVPMRKRLEFLQLNWSSSRSCIVGCNIPAQGFILKQSLRIALDHKKLIVYSQMWESRR